MKPRTVFSKLNMIMIVSAVMISLLLVSCKGLELEDKTEQVEEYTRPQAMILVANERNRYQNAYSEDIWQYTGEKEADKFIVDNVKTYMEQLMTVCMLAEEYGISISSQDRDLIRQMTDEYMQKLTKEDLSYIGCQREDVQKLYTDMYTAFKLIENITSGRDDISDSEVKVIKIQQIGTEDQKKAKAILKRIKIDGADFLSMAGRYTELDEIELTLMRGTDNGIIEQTAYNLEEGKVSNILYTDGMYYIIKCVNGYDEDATLSRKARIYEAMNEKSFREVFDPYKKEHKVKFIDPFWEEISFSEKTGSTAENFFDVFGYYWSSLK